MSENAGLIEEPVDYKSNCKNFRKNKSSSRLNGDPWFQASLRVFPSRSPWLGCEQLVVLHFSFRVSGRRVCEKAQDALTGQLLRLPRPRRRSTICRLSTISNFIEIVPQIGVIDLCQALHDD